MHGNYLGPYINWFGVLLLWLCRPAWLGRKDSEAAHGGCLVWGQALPYIILQVPTKQGTRGFRALYSRYLEGWGSSFGGCWVYVVIWTCFKSCYEEIIHKIPEQMSFLRFRQGFEGTKHKTLNSTLNPIPQGAGCGSPATALYTPCEPGVCLPQGSLKQIEGGST